MAETLEAMTAEQLGVEFDLSRMTAQDYHDWNAAARKDDMMAVARILARLAVKCPPAWGKPDDAKTYLKLPMFGTFKQLSRAFGMAVRDEAGK